MRRIAAIVSIAGTVVLSSGCGPSMRSVIEERIPELRRLETGTYDLGDFKKGQTTPYRMMPVVNNEPRTIAFTTVPESRRFNIVLDDGRVFKFDDDSDLAELAETRLGRQSFYIEFRQDIHMIVVVSRPAVQMGER
jgi:hypothetical protein